MEWEKYKSWFKRGQRIKKKIAHNTWAYLVPNVGDKGQERIEIQLHKKEILVLWPNGDFEVNNHDYWQSPVTKDRFRRFLPWRGHISSWPFKAVTHRGAAESTVRVWSLWMTGCGSHPWHNNKTYNSSGHREDLNAYANQLDANEACSLVSPLAVATIKELFAGRLEHDCGTCKSASLEMDYVFGGVGHAEDKTEYLAFWTKHVYEEHLKTCKPSMGVATLAAYFSKRRDHVQAVNLLRPHNRVLWMKPRNQRQLADQVERTLAGDYERLGSGDPLAYKRTLRWDIEKYLLELLGFEVS